MKFLRLALLLTFLVGGLSLSQGFERKLTINMGEMFFQAAGQAKNAPINIEPGVPYRLTFKNVGTVVHRVKFGRGLIVEEGVPFAYTENLFKDVLVKVRGAGEETTFRVVADQLIELDLDAGQEIEVLFTLPADKSGEWELGCFVVGHYEAGMHAPLVIQ